MVGMILQNAAVPAHCVIAGCETAPDADVSESVWH